MDKQIELRLTGSGGQGLILAGIIFAEAAILDSKNAVQTQSYGPEARGGASKAEVIISDGVIDFPKVVSPDLILVLTQVACDKYIETVSKDGIIVVDSSIEIPKDLVARKIVVAPILETAKTEIGKVIVANIVAMGVITELTGIVTKDSLLKAILSRVPKGTETLNKKALECGYELANKY